MTWFRKFSFDYDNDDDGYEDVFKDVPIPTAIPAKYEDVGHGEGENIPWFFIDGKIISGTTSHMDILDRIRKEKGPEVAFDVLMNNWRGRYDTEQHEMSMTIEKAERAEVEVQPPAALVLLLQTMFPEVERIWSFPGSRPVLGHFDDDALDRVYKFAWKHHFAENYFEQGQQSYQNPSDDSPPSRYMELDDHLKELFKVEYVIGELKRRGHANQRLPFSRRYTHWLQKLEDHALGLATREVGPKMLYYIDQWLQFHSGSGFAEEVVGLEDGASSIMDDGIIRLGGNFEYQIGNEVIDAYLKANPAFVRDVFNDEWNDTDYLQEFTERQGESPLEWDEQQQFEHVKESIESMGHSFQDLRKWLGEWGDFDAALMALIKTHVYPAWRTYWGNSIEVAEENVQGSYQRLEQALESEDLGNIFAAINIALNAQHVHGGMYERMDLSKDLMEELSALDTDELDGFVNMVTSEDWKGAAKVAQYIPSEVPKFFHEEFEVIISDVDRYTADKYWITVQILESIHKYSIGLNIINSHVGICGQGQYWHFQKDELSKAKKTFAEIKKIAQKLHDEIEYIRPPMAIIAPMFRSAMHYVDYPHRERSGVYHYNWFEELPKAADWRQTLYGNRYPHPPTATQRMGDFLINFDERGKDVVSEGSSRGRHMYYKQASGDDPLGLATLIGRHWRWTIPTATAFLAWFASVGGNSNQLVQDIQRGAQPQEVLRQVQPENLDDQVSETVPEAAFEPETPEIAEIPQESETSVDVSPETEYDTSLDVKNLNGLDPMFANKIKQILLRLTQKGWQPRVAEGLRSLEEQQSKIDQDRSSLKNPRNSKHVQGLAVDIIDSRYGWNGPAEDLDFGFWNDLGEAAREAGLTWGGDWKSFRDVAHVEAAGHQKGGMVYHHAYQITDKFEAKARMYATMRELQTTDWNVIVRSLIQQGVDNRLFSWLNQQWITCLATNLWTHKYAVLT